MDSPALLRYNTDPKVLEQSHVLVLLQETASVLLLNPECSAMGPKVQFNHSSSLQIRYSLNFSLRLDVQIE